MNNRNNLSSRSVMLALAAVVGIAFISIAAVTQTNTFISNIVSSTAVTQSEPDTNCPSLGQAATAENSGAFQCTSFLTTQTLVSTEAPAGCPSAGQAFTTESANGGAGCGSFLTTQTAVSTEAAASCSTTGQYARTENANGQFGCANVQYGNVTNFPTGSGSCSSNDIYIYKINQTNFYCSQVVYSGIGSFPSGSGGCSSNDVPVYKINSTNFYCAQIVWSGIGSFPTGSGGCASSSSFVYKINATNYYCSTVTAASVAWSSITGFPSGSGGCAINTAFVYKINATNYYCSNVSWANIISFPSGSGGCALNSVFVYKINATNYYCSGLTWGNILSFPTGSGGCAISSEFVYKINATNYYCSTVSWTNLANFPAACLGSYVSTVGNPVVCSGDNTNSLLNTQSAQVGFYFPLDEGSGNFFYDLSNNLNPVTSTGDAFVPLKWCVQGGCVRFVNTSSGFFNTGATYTTLPFTEAFWFNATALPVNGNHPSELAQILGGDLSIKTNATASYVQLSGLGLGTSTALVHISLKHWYFVAAVVNASGQAIWVNSSDSTLSGSGLLAGTPSSAAVWTFAKAASSSFYYFAGALDEIYLFQRTLSLGQLYTQFFEVSFPIETQLAVLAGEHFFPAFSGSPVLLCKNTNRILNTIPATDLAMGTCIIPANSYTYIEIEASGYAGFDQGGSSNTQIILFTAKAAGSQVDNQFFLQPFAVNVAAYAFWTVSTMESFTAGGNVSVTVKGNSGADTHTTAYETSFYVWGIV